MTAPPMTEEPGADARRPKAVQRIAGVLVIVASLAGAGWVLQVERAQEQMLARRLESGVQRAHAGVRNWEQLALTRTRAWASEAAIAANTTELPPALASAARSASTDGVRAVAILSPDGRLLASSAPTLLVDPTIGQRVAAVQRAAAGTASVAGPIWPARTRAARGAGEWLYISAAPVREADGRVIAVLAFFHDADAPLRAVRQLLRQDPQLETYLVSEEGERISTVGGVEAPLSVVTSPAAPAISAPNGIGASSAGTRLDPYTGALGRRVASAWEPAAPLAARLVYEVDADALGSGGPIAYGVAIALVLAAVAAGLLGRSATSARKRSNAQQAEVAAVVDSAPHAVLVADAKGRVTRANAKAALLLDASVIAIVGSPLEKWVKGPIAVKGDRLGAWLEQAAREGTARRADGREVAVEMRVGQGEFAGEALFVMVLMDRAEQAGAAKASKEAREDAAKARQRQSELVQAMHQEIRTPMSRVMGMAHLLKDSALSPVQQGYVESLMRSAQTMMTFVTDVVDLAKMEQGTLQLVEAPFDVRSAIEEVGAMTSGQATMNSVRLESRVSERTPAWVMGDAGRFKQVLITLVGNGIRFAANGRVDVKVDGEPKGREVRIQVKVADTGPGMDAETMRRLFAKDPTTVSKLAGGGLGLSMVKHLVELMGGRIEVKSLQGEGTTFQLHVMVRAAEGQTNAPAASKLAGARALVVDASEAEGAVTKEWLRSWGMRVESTTTAEEAIGHLRRAVAEGDPVEVALVDRQALGEQADAFARRLRSEPGLAGTGLLIATSAPVAGEAEKLAAAGCDAIVPRPFGASTLSRSLAAVVERPRGSRGNGTLVSGDAPMTPARKPIEPVDGHIPVVEEPSAPKRFAPEPLADGRIRVLLAEDNRVNQIVATNLLQRLGCRVEVVRDGAEAVKVASRNEFDVIMMDIQMPHLDGCSATTLIRRLPAPFNGPHIIAMGTSASPDERDRYLAAGMDDVVHKPLTPESVQSALERRPAGVERVPV